MNTYGSLLEIAQKTYSLEELYQADLAIGDSLLHFHPLEHNNLSQFMVTRPSEVARGQGLKTKLQGCFNRDYRHIQFKPTLLDRPLVVTLEQPIHLAPHSQLVLNVSRPIAYEVKVSNERSEMNLCHVPTKLMRLTSYGQVTQPMVCYHWQTPNVQHASDGNEALVPLQIYNQSKQTVALRKLTLYKGFLKLFQGSHGFITNIVSVMIHSKTEAYLEYMKLPPENGEEYRLLFEAAYEPKNKLLKMLRLMSKRGTGIEYGF